MRIGVIERLAAQTMAARGMTRAQALRRHALVWGGLGALCLGAAQAGPVAGLMLARRGAEVPLAVLLTGCGGLFLALAAAFLLSLRGDEG
ncbi:hypothetical protein [Roseicyclus persicicus]|uniref:Uncharacterized protein n=1 Tax=Roseicyclus persicicus TaxID=2650661 RepID=A0A7X6H151_9RHOB|nr:hypothetical protein [Roseibacterium persicicum]NKX46126.1 hypothetical protein [Roseibacterium persicicum]